MITSSYRITIVNSASIVVIARNLFAYTTSIRITGFIVTCITVASDKVISTSDYWVAIVSMTEVSSLTLSANVRVYTSVFSIAGIFSTSVAIVTFNIAVLASRTETTRIYGTSIVIIAVNRHIITEASVFIAEI